MFGVIIWAMVKRVSVFRSLGFMRSESIWIIWAIECMDGCLSDEAMRLRCIVLCRDIMMKHLDLT